MRIWVKRLAPCLLVAVLAAPVLITGCKTQNTTVNDDEQHPSDYAQWERETHRQHQDYNKRSSDEQKQYRDWQQSHDNHH
jgi:hypothetical protein